MSERRQLALLFAGLVLLTAVGVVGATVFPEPCEELEQVGDLELRFTDATDALPVDVAAGAVIEDLGEDAGIGAWRGAVALPDGAQVSRSEFGFFVTTAEDFVVLRPSMGIASAARGRIDLDVTPAGTSLALRAEDGQTGIVNSEYEMDRCGELPNGEILALDRGFAVVREAAEVALVTLSGDELWRAPAVAAAHITDDAVLLGQDGLVEARALRDGEVLDRFTDVPVPAPAPWLWADGDTLLLSGAGGVVPVTVGDAALGAAAPIDLSLVDAVTAAVATPGGVVGLGQADPGEGPTTAALATATVTDPAVLPPGVVPLELHASEDGHVGLLVEVDGVRALLVYGPLRDESAGS